MSPRKVSAARNPAAESAAAEDLMERVSELRESAQRIYEKSDELHRRAEDAHHRAGRLHKMAADPRGKTRKKRGAK